MAGKADEPLGMRCGSAGSLRQRSGARCGALAAYREDVHVFTSVHGGGVKDGEDTFGRARQAVLGCAGGEGEAIKRFCRGHSDANDARADAIDRTVRAKDLGISATYSDIPKPTA